MSKSFKSFFVASAVSLVFLGLPTTDAEAFSVKLNGGLQNLTPDTDGESSGFTAGLDVFFYEGRILDVFAGAEYAEWRIKDGSISGSGSQSGSSYSYTDLEFSTKSYIVPWKLGVNLKYPTEGRVKPFVSLAALYGTYSNDFLREAGHGGSLSSSNFNFTITNQNEVNDEGTFFGYRAGLGANVGITENLSLALEANYTAGVPAIEITLGETNFVSREQVIVTVDENSPILGVTAGLKYQFY